MWTINHVVEAGHNSSRKRLRPKRVTRQEEFGVQLHAINGSNSQDERHVKLLLVEHAQPSQEELPQLLFVDAGVVLYGGSEAFLFRERLALLSAR